MTKPFLYILIAIFVYAPVLFAEDPGALKEQANGQVMAASRLMQQGMSLIHSPTVENKRTAIQMLIQAGQLFEQSAQVYQSLMPQYAAQSDVDNSRKAMENCINAIDQLKQGL